MSHFAVANGMEAEVKEAFRNRPHLVDDAPGFLRMDVMSPIDTPQEIWLVTYWADEQSFRSWYRSHAFKASHEAMPKGLKLNPEFTEIRYFEHVTS